MSVWPPEGQDCLVPRLCVPRSRFLPPPFLTPRPLFSSHPAALELEVVAPTSTEVLEGRRAVRRWAETHGAKIAALDANPRLLESLLALVKAEGPRKTAVDASGECVFLELAPPSRGRRLLALEDDSAEDRRWSRVDDQPDKIGRSLRDEGEDSDDEGVVRDDGGDASDGADGVAAAPAPDRAQGAGALLRSAGERTSAALRSANSMFSSLASQPRRHLVLGIVGDGEQNAAALEQWLEGSERGNYDIAVVYTGSGEPPEADGAISVVNVRAPALRAAAIAARAMDATESLAKRYASVALLDVSVRTDSCRLTRAFELVARHELLYAAPSLCRGPDGIEAGDDSGLRRLKQLEVNNGDLTTRYQPTSGGDSAVEVSVGDALALTSSEAAAEEQAAEDKALEERTPVANEEPDKPTAGYRSNPDLSQELSAARWRAIALQEKNSTLRYTSWAPTSAPIFSTARGFFSDVVVPTMHDAHSGAGLGFLWPYLLGFPRRRVAIIDEVCVHSTGISRDSGLASWREAQLHFAEYDLRRSKVERMDVEFLRPAAFAVVRPANVSGATKVTNLVRPRPLMRRVVASLHSMLFLIFMCGSLSIIAYEAFMYRKHQRELYYKR